MKLYLEDARWQEARSLKYRSEMMKHQYTLRKWWRSPARFDQVLDHLRRHGETRAFGKWDYIEFVPEGSEFFYWNVDPSWEGRGPEWAWLINRKPLAMRSLRPRVKKKPAGIQLPLWALNTLCGLLRVVGFRAPG